MALLSIALCTQLSFGQVTTQDVTDASESKATLTVTSSDVSGFQYKYGTLVEKDEIANYALAELSDPIAFTQGTYAWSARSAKGWVESNKDLSSGQSSVMYITFTLTRETEISFEWSVDSEENYGILSFVVDGTTVNSISGYIDFTTVTHTLSAGGHTLQWIYEKKSATNVGLDLGMVRNINIQNSTPGEWINKPTTSTSYQLTNLYPGQDYIFRAYHVADSDTTFSIIRQFATDSVSVDNVTISPITQATATLQGSVYPGDTEVEKGFEICSDILGLKNANNSTSALNLFSHPISNEVTISTDYYWQIEDGYMYCNIAGEYLNIKFPQLKSPSEISFNFATGSTSYYGTLYYDYLHVYYYYYDSQGNSNSGHKEISSHKLNSNYYSLDLPTNTYMLQFYGEGGRSSYYAYCELSNITIQALKPSLSPENKFSLAGGNNLSHIVTGLKPNTSYSVRSYIKPAFSSELDTTWSGTYSDWVEFSTLPITADTLSVINKKQASVTIRGKVNGGDASIIAKGLQYRDATGQRWTTYPTELTASDELSVSIKRLKPATSYRYRSYIQANDCDTVFSVIGSFTTDSVKAIKPTLLNVTQLTAKIQGEVNSGDATIYTRGMQFRKASDNVWTEIEDGGEDSIYITEQNNLQLYTAYQARTYVQPAGCDTVFSEILNFNTLNIITPAPEILEKTQLTAKIQSKVVSGDATTISRGLEIQKGKAVYVAISGPTIQREATNIKKYIYSFWGRFPNEESDSTFTSIINGLEPNISPNNINNSYRARTYAVSMDGDTIYSNYTTFTSEPVQIHFPELIDTTQSTATFKSKVIYGDAPIEACGIQYSLDSYNVWNDISNSIDSIFVTKCTNLYTNTAYKARTFIKLAERDTAYSDEIEFRTKPISAHIDSINTSQRKAVIYGHLDIGDAPISGGITITGNNDFRENIDIELKHGNFIVSINNLTPLSHYTCTLNIWDSTMDNVSKKTFTTKSYFKKNNNIGNVYTTDITQTKATLCAEIEYTEDYIEDRGFVYWITYGATDSTFVSGTLAENILSTRVENLDPSHSYSFIEYTKVDGKYYYDYSMMSYNPFEADYFSTKGVWINAIYSNITQTKADMKATIDAGDAIVSDLMYRLNNSEEYLPYSGSVKYTNLTPNTYYNTQFKWIVNGKEYNLDENHFKTKAVTVGASVSDVTQTSALAAWTPDYGDATYVASGIRYSKNYNLYEADTITNDEFSARITELDFNTTYYYQAYLTTEEGGTVFSNTYNFCTSQISLETLGVTNISNRSATLNGTIDCDSYSSAEFGFQWKPMTGLADPGFTKGYKTEDGDISVSLVNGMLTPDTDYQYRTAIRYKGQYYYTSDWTTFRTELEYVLYPGTAYTLWRTDRENNCIVFCGYYVAGSEDVKTYGYEYWSSSSITPKTSDAGVIRVTTDANMEYRLDIASMQDGIYSVRAFVETESGTTYGQTLSFSISNGEVGSVDTIETDEIICIGTQTGIIIKNAIGLSVYIANLNGQIVAIKHDMTDLEHFELQKDTIYLIKLSNGQTFKIKI